MAGEVDETLASPFFWAFLHLLDALNSILTHITAWCESCACHPPEVRKALAELGITGSCPLRGRRCPELAAGGLEHVVLEVSQLEVGNLLLKYCGDLSPHERARLVSDFELGRQCIEMQLRVKLAAWKVLPLQLLGMGHHDINAARYSAVTCLAQWAQLPADSRPRAHPLSRMLLSADHENGLRRHVVAFARGAAAEPRLQQILDSFLFIPNVEIGVERLHAYISQRLRIAHHHSPAYVSCIARKNEILSQLYCL